MIGSLFLGVDDVVARLEIEPSQISATTVPLSSTAVEGFILDGEAQMQSVLNQAGITFDGLSDSDLRQIRVCVLSYAVSESLSVQGQRGTVRQTQAWNEWQDILRRYEARGTLLQSRANRTLTNAPQCRRKMTFQGRDYDH